MIQKAKLEDYPTLIEIWESAVLATHDFLSKGDFEFYKSRLPIYFDQLELYTYIGIENRIEGFLGTSEDKIEMLFIHDNYRRYGVGRSLLNFAINNLNLHKVDVNEDNIQALDFYKYFGFNIKSKSDFDAESKNYPILHLSL